MDSKNADACLAQISMRVNTVVCSMTSRCHIPGQHSKALEGFENMAIYLEDLYRKVQADPELYVSMTHIFVFKRGVSQFEPRAVSYDQ